LNKEITIEIATKQILSTMKNIQNQIICGICKISLYKTEKCNGLSHHNLERCYSCSRIGYPIRGLDDHWSLGGVDGCFRFDNDSFVKNYIPEYICNDSVCSNHEKGDCMINEHQIGIEKLNIVRKSAYVYHMLKSLLCDIKFQVYDQLYNICKDDPELLDFLPYKQTLILLNKFRKQYRSYCEDIVYKQLHCKNVNEIFTNKMEFVSATEYVQTYTIPNEILISETWALDDENYNLDILTDTNSDLHSTDVYPQYITNDLDLDISDVFVRQRSDRQQALPIVVNYDLHRSEENVLNLISYDVDSNNLIRLLDILQHQLFHDLEENLEEN
jgi:hypothetical protein